jgi:hypothetical protein
MTSREFVERLKVLAARKTYYKNKWPDNLCYVHTDGRTSADCVNLLKAVLNGYNVYNNTPGYYQKNLSNTSDCTEYGLLKQCTDVSSDFKKLKAGEPRLLYMKGHVGAFIGSCIVNGKEYNCIECTAAWGGGILYSYVAENGERYNHKGGSRNGKWTQHGKMTPWVEYVDVQKPKYDFTEFPVLKKGSKGEWVKILQKLLVEKGYDPKGIDGIFGPGCLAAVKKFQSENTDADGKKLVVDGYVGPKTWAALYK